MCEQCGGALAPDRPKTPTGASEPGRYLGRMISQRYRVVERIARGGMGEVYVAEHAEMQQLVAVKFLHKRYAHDESFAARFFNEARYAAQVTHPNAVALYDFGRLDDGTLFIVMEYVRGESLSRVVRGQGMIPVPMALRVASQIAEVLASAHEKRIIHRDVKPDNIMLVQGVGGRVSVKVLDFGIAKILDDEDGHHTEPGIMFGTPEYMSPEQALGHVYDHRVDVYALGLVMYYMLAGNPPFSGANKMAVLQAQVREQAPPLERSAKQPVPKRLVRFIDRMLSKNPHDRPADMVEVLQELDAIQAADEQGQREELPAYDWTGEQASGRAHTQAMVKGAANEHVAAVEELAAAVAREQRRHENGERAGASPQTLTNEAATHQPSSHGIAETAYAPQPAASNHHAAMAADGGPALDVPTLFAKAETAQPRTSTPMSQKRAAPDWTPIAPAPSAPALGAVGRKAEDPYTLTGGGTYANPTPLTFNPLSASGAKRSRAESALILAIAALLCGLAVFGALFVSMTRSSSADDVGPVTTTPGSIPGATVESPSDADADADDMGAMASVRNADSTTAAQAASPYDAAIETARRSLADGKLADARTALGAIPSRAAVPRFAETRALLLRAETLEQTLTAALAARECGEAREAQRALQTEISAPLAASHDAAIRRCTPTPSVAAAPAQTPTPTPARPAAAAPTPARPSAAAPASTRPSQPAPPTRPSTPVQPPAQPARPTPVPAASAPSRLPDTVGTPAATPPPAEAPPARTSAPVPSAPAPATPAVPTPAPATPAPATPAAPTPAAPARPPSAPADVLPPMEL